MKEHTMGQVLRIANRLNSLPQNIERYNMNMPVDAICPRKKIVTIIQKMLTLFP